MYVNVSLLYYIKLYLVQVSCGGRVTNNRTHFLSPMFPQSFNQEMRCQISVTLPSDACQLRLHFVRFLLSNPKHSQCVIDALTIPNFINIPVLCGNLTGQHSMPSLNYYHYSSIQNIIQLN